MQLSILNLVSFRSIMKILELWIRGESYSTTACVVDSRRPVERIVLIHDTRVDQPSTVVSQSVTETDDRFVVEQDCETLDQRDVCLVNQAYAYFTPTACFSRTVLFFQATYELLELLLKRYRRTCWAIQRDYIYIRVDFPALTALDSLKSISLTSPYHSQPFYVIAAVWSSSLWSSLM